MNLPTPRDLLRLLRISNLPTVWTNAFLGWWLAGGGPWLSYLGAALALSALYGAGMVLNDARDADWDAAHNPGRPIPSGRVSRRFAWGAGGLLLGLGIGIAFVTSPIAGLYAVGLAAAILLYGEIHKSQPGWGALTMGVCRSLAIVTGAAASPSNGSPAAWVAALAVGTYVIAVTRLARDEHLSAPPRPPFWTWPLLFAPWVVAALWMPATAWTDRWALLPALAWTAFALRNLALHRGRLIGDLLSGLCLLDLALVAPVPPPIAGAMLAAFALCLLLRRRVPAS